MQNNGTLIGVQEKREIAKIITAEYTRKISEVEQNINYTTGDVLTRALRHFGIPLINKQIEQLKKQIILLESKKEELGFNSSDNFETAYQGNDGFGIKKNTKAGKFYYLKMSAHEDVKELINARDTRLKKLWLTPERTVVKDISDEKIDVKMITFKK